MLYLQREGGPKLRLMQAAKDEFTLAEVPEARLKFVRDENGKIKHVICSAKDITERKLLEQELTKLRQQLVGVECRLPVCIADDPLCCVVLGTSKILSDFKLLRRIEIE